MNHKKNLFLPLSLLLTFMFGVLLYVSPVEAQSDATQEAKENSIVQVFNKDQQTEKISALKILYRDQVEKYRDSEKAFRIAKTNYENLNTLIALEEAVEATKQVMLNRTDVLVTYLELLDVTLEDTAGVELSEKNDSLKELKGLINAIKLHKDTVLVTTNRDGISTLADEFESIELAYDLAVYKALSLIRVGKIQTVRDQAQIINSDIVDEQNQEEVGTLIESKRERAYNEIDRNFESINEDLAELNDRIIFADENTFQRSFYQRILRDLAPVYAEISQSLEHLEEILRI